MPRTNIFGKTLVTTALLLYCCFNKKIVPSGAPLSPWVLRVICPGYDAAAEPLIHVWNRCRGPSPMVYSCLVSMLSSLWSGFPRYCKVLVLVKVKVMVTQDCLKARITQKVSVKGSGPDYA